MLLIELIIVIEWNLEVSAVVGDRQVKNGLRMFIDAWPVIFLLCFLVRIFGGLSDLTSFGAGVTILESILTTEVELGLYFGEESVGIQLFYENE